MTTFRVGLTDVSREGGRARLTLTIVGLISTVIAVVFVTKAARRALVEELKRDER